MMISEVTREEEFDSLRPEWNLLVSRLAVPSPFQSWEWYRTWWKHFGSGGRLRILAFRDAGQLAGIAQFYERHYGSRYVGPTLIAPLGWQDHRRRQGITEQSELLFPADRSGDLLTALSKWLDEHRWTVALLPGLQGPHQLPTGLSQKVVLAGKPSWLYYRSLPPTWPDFLSSLGKSMRDNVKYYPRLLERTGHPFRLRVADASAPVSTALRTFLDLHRARAAAATSAITHRDKFAHKDRRAFLLEVGPILADLGQLKVGLLEVDEKVVAAQIWLEMRDTMFLYYTGYDPAWSKFSVQLVATLECLKVGMARGIQRVEFLRGGAKRQDQRNERWETSHRERVNLTLAHRPAVPRLLLRLPRVQRRLQLHGTSVTTGGGLQ
jgi:GNAT acetyltransferase-like protein